jgi:hypothetical protein
VCSLLTFIICFFKLVQYNAANPSEAPSPSAVTTVWYMSEFTAPITDSRYEALGTAINGSLLGGKYHV